MDVFCISIHIENHFPQPQSHLGQPNFLRCGSKGLLLILQAYAILFPRAAARLASTTTEFLLRPLAFSQLWGSRIGLWDILDELPTPCDLTVEELHSSREAWLDSWLAWQNCVNCTDEQVLCSVKIWHANRLHLFLLHGKTYWTLFKNSKINYYNLPQIIVSALEKGREFLEVINSPNITQGEGHHKGDI